MICYDCAQGHHEFCVDKDADYRGCACQHLPRGSKLEVKNEV